MKLKEINSLLPMDIGAPIPVIISGEYKLDLLYFYDKEFEKSTTGYLDMPQERHNSDMGIAHLSFKYASVHKFGYPNDEVLSAHPYYSLGLSSYTMFEVEGSDWIAAIEKMNQVHISHNPGRFKLLRHYIITFKDSTFECIAEGVEFKFMKGISMNEALLQVCKSFIR
jgi:hypothetical protein